MHTGEHSRTFLHIVAGWESLRGGMQEPGIYRRLETRALELRWDQRGKIKQQSVKAQGGPGFKLTPRQRRVQILGRPGALPLYLLQRDRSTEEFNPRMTLNPSTEGVALALGFRTIFGVDSQGLSCNRTAPGSVGECSSGRPGPGGMGLAA